MNSFIKSLILISISIVILLSCSKNNQNTISGEVVYPKPITLTEEAVVKIQLLDISKRNEKVKVIAEKIIKNPGQIPIAFDIQYNPGDILPINTYSLKVIIEDNGSLLFTTDTMYPVINNGIAEGIKLKVVPTDSKLKLETEGVNSTTQKFNVNTPTEIAALVDEMQLVTGKWYMGEAKSTFQAYYAGDELKLIIEKMDMGEYGSSEYRYYFKNGYLFYYEQNGKRTAPNSKHPDEADNVNVVMHFDKEGTLVASSKKINFQPVELHDIEAPGVLKHCEVLVAISKNNYQLAKK